MGSHPGVVPQLRLVWEGHILVHGRRGTECGWRRPLWCMVHLMSGFPPAFDACSLRWRAESGKEAAATWQRLASANAAVADSLERLQALSVTDPSGYRSAVTLCSTTRPAQVTGVLTLLLLLPHLDAYCSCQSLLHARILVQSYRPAASTEASRPWRSCSQRLQAFGSRLPFHTTLVLPMFAVGRIVRSASSNPGAGPRGSGWGRPGPE